MHRLGTLLAGLVVMGCGGRALAPPVSTPTAGSGPREVTAARSSAPLGALRRSAVQETLSAGPGAFLQTVTVDEHPVYSGSKFQGFRIKSLHGDAWAGVDLRPGDVVMRVNGFSIEHPEDAAEAFYSLRVASELRVELERDGEPRELRFAIVDDGPFPDAGARRD